MAIDSATELLRGHGLRVTPQRRAVLRSFSPGGDEHLSAEEVASRAAESVPNIGRGTVYAILAELSELGVLTSVGNSEPIRFETNTEPHDHFRCLLCLRLYDVELGGRELSRRLLPGFEISEVAVQAEGVCAQCGRYRDGLRDGVAHALATETLPEDDLGDLACLTLDSPLGELATASSAEGIVHIAYRDHRDFDLLQRRAHSRRGPKAARARLSALRGWIEAYLSGEEHAPASAVVDWRLLDQVQRRALGLVRDIPYARRRSYEQLRTGLDGYALGYLMGVNPLPLIIPCHRVTRGAERPQVYVGGAERLQYLQRLEQSQD